MIGRYVFRMQLGASFLVLFVVFLVMVLAEISDVGRGQDEATLEAVIRVFRRAALSASRFLQPALPYVVVVAAVIATNRLISRNEVACMFAAGLSPVRFLVATATAAIFLGVAFAVVVAPLSAWLNAQVYGMAPASDTDTVVPGPREVFLEDATGGNYVFAAGIAEDGMTLTRVDHIRVDDQHRLVRFLNAERAHWDGTRWVLENPSDVLLASGQLDTRVTRLPEVVTQEALTRKLRSARSVPIYEVPREIAFAEKIGAPTLRLQLKMQALLSLPVFLGSCAMLAAALTLRPRPRMGWGGDLFRVFVIVFMLYLVTTLANSIGESGRLPATVVVWSLPLFCCLATGMVLGASPVSSWARRRARERPQGQETKPRYA